MNRMLKLFCFVCAGTAVLGLAGCGPEEETVERKLGFEEFVPLYNRYIADWLAEMSAGTEKEIAEVERQLAEATEENRVKLEGLHADLLRDREKWAFRKSLGGYMKIGTPDEVPDDLVWKNGMEQPEIGDPNAKKGGVFRRYVPSFPPTIRPFGDNSNNSFRGDLYDYIELPLVTLHPETMELSPGLAKEWAVSKDKRTVYFRLDPEARYSDGVPVKAMDYLVGVYVRVSDHVVNPYAKQYFRESLAQFATYGDGMLSVSLPEVQIYRESIAGSMTPSPPHFYKDYGPDYSERYQWKFPPTTGAYEVLPGDIVKGVSITQTRVKDWWAKDRKYYRYRYNPDKMVHTVVRDESKAFELFRAGQLDTFLITKPELWYEKSEMEPVYKGYIERATFYTQYPRVPIGQYMNVSKPLLSDRNVRVGIQHSMNWQKVIDVIHRGDYQRLNAFNEGYKWFSDPTIRARKYSVRRAREEFAKAGFVEEGSDGILRREDGTRLSVPLLYAKNPRYDRMFAILREDAKACGFDLRLDGQEQTVSYKTEMQKQHEMTFGAWIIQPPVPRFYQFLHSRNAYDEDGNLKPQTNNTFVWARDDTDALSVKVRTGETREEVAEAAKKLQRIIHDEAIFVPGYAVDFVRVGSWRWVRWPDSEFTKFCPPVVYDPHEMFVFWIDDEKKRETQAARRTGKAFPEVNVMIDDYRLTGDEEPEPEDAAEAAVSAEDFEEEE